MPDGVDRRARRRRSSRRARRFENVAAALERVGAALGDVVRTRVFVTDTRPLRRRRPRPRRGASATSARSPRLVVVAELLDPRMLVEIEADAYVAAGPAGRSRAALSGVRGPSGASRSMPPPCPPPRRHPSARRCGRGSSGRSWRCAHGDGPVPHLRRARRGQDAPGARASPASCCARGAVRRVVVVCPTTPLTRQWAAAAGRLGRAPRRPTPPSCARRATSTASPSPTRGSRRSAERWARQCSAPARSSSPTRRTTSARTSPGARGSHRAFGDAARWLLLSGTPFRSDADADPGRPLRRRRRRPGRLLHLRRRGPRRHLPAGRRSSPTTASLQWRSGDDVVEASFADALTGREAARRYRTAISVELADGLPRILAAAHARLAGGAGRRPPRRRRPRRRRRRRARARDRQGAPGHHGPRRRSSSCTPRRARRRSSPRSRAPREPLDRRGEHGLRGRRHPAPARRRLRDGGQDAADLPPDRRALRPDDPRPRRSTAAGSTCPPTRCCAAHASDVERELRHVLRPPGEDDPAALDEPPERRESERVRAAGLRARRRRRRAAARALRRAARARRPRRSRPAPCRRRAPTDAGQDADDAALPAFERRALLRDKRHRLVADLRRRDGRSHAEINALAQPQRAASAASSDASHRPARALDRAAARRARGAAAAARRRAARAVVPPPAAGRPARGRRATPRPAGRRPARPRGGDAPRGRARPRRRGSSRSAPHRSHVQALGHLAAAAAVADEPRRALAARSGGRPTAAARSITGHRSRPFSVRRYSKRSGRSW